MSVNQHILQVSELTKKVRFILESEMRTCWLVGEISNFVAASSGHWYLSLKDSRSQVRCAMFKGTNARVRVTPANGKQVLVRAKISLYEPRGEFQLILEQMEDAGEGLLRQQYEALKNRLNAEGLFQQSIKQALPDHINTVGIVTSPTGAAVKDILSVLKRRNPAINVIIYPALVQGELAKQDISLAINKASDRQECDVLIVGRGGGSLEDLWCFNEEQVVRAIYQCRLPVISAVGHEIDTTLSDYVADLRAPTPSAAAELVSRDQQELKDNLHVINARLHMALKTLLTQKKRVEEASRYKLLRSHPEQKLQVQAQRIDELIGRIAFQGQRLTQAKSNQLTLQVNNLMHHSPLNQLQATSNRHQQLKERLLLAGKQHINAKQQAFANTIEQLHIVSPLATIARGYSVVRNPKNEIVKSTSQVSSGDEVSIQVSDGKISAIVKE